ncbi:hypothetical protein [Agromyces neolithicus]|uniref:ApeA N-terminal domain-containing protein n=1 Tax=Agromyces neolithicus TaxID=269420 RepID=A0ABN2MC98_9MICO
MADGVPLNLLLQPGEYRVEWQLPDQSGGVITLQGELELASDRPPRGEAFGDVPVAWMHGVTGLASFPQTYEADKIVGRLLNGFNVVLIDASVQIWFPERAIIHARAALLGREAFTGTDIRVAGIEVQVEGLDAATGIGPISEVKIPMKREEGRRYLDWNWEAVGNPDSTQTWADGDAEVELQFYSSVTAPEGFFFRVTFSPIVLIRPAVPIPFDDAFSGWIEPLRRIISLATGRKEKITYLAVRLLVDDEETRPFQVFGTALHQAPYSSRGNDVLKVERSFLLSPQDMSLLALLRRWQQLQAEHHPLLETYGAMMFAPDQHPRSRLLLLLQALEGMHGHENAADFSMRVLAHTERRDFALAEAGKALSSDAVKFLKRHLSRRPASSLQQVLGETLTAVPVDITPDLEGSDLVDEVMADARKPTNSYDALRLVRNDLAHGTRGYDFQALHAVSTLLDGVVRAHMLRILDCSEEAQRRTQERRR